jgi:hypothetical protein
VTLDRGRRLDERLLVDGPKPRVLGDRLQRSLEPEDVPVLVEDAAHELADMAAMVGVHRIVAV